jgi:hypothetical protein
MDHHGTCRREHALQGSHVVVGCLGRPGPRAQGRDERGAGTPERGAVAQGTILFHMDSFDRLLLQKFELGDEKIE